MTGLTLHQVQDRLMVLARENGVPELASLASELAVTIAEMRVAAANAMPIAELAAIHDLSDEQLREILVDVEASA